MTEATTLTFEQVYEQIAYDPETGVFTWRVGKKGQAGPGSIAGCLNKHLGYWQIGILRQRLYGHRLAWLLSYGCWPTHQIDHINGDRSDNRLTNLREATHADNQQNRHLYRNRTGFAGVEYCPKFGRFRARVVHNQIKHCAGHYDTAEEAHAAYLAKKAELHAYHTASFTVDAGGHRR